MNNNITVRPIYIHIITCGHLFYSYPNNPNGVHRNPLVKNQQHVIRDMVYYWPMYTDIDLMISQPIMIFSRCGTVYPVSVSIVRMHVYVNLLQLCLLLSSSYRITGILAWLYFGEMARNGPPKILANFLFSNCIRTTITYAHVTNSWQFIIVAVDSFSIVKSKTTAKISCYKVCCSVYYFPGFSLST